MPEVEDFEMSPLAFLNTEFLKSPAARTIRIVSEYLEPADRLRRARIPYARVAENVAKGSSAMAAHRGAEDSPAHRENILSTAARQARARLRAFPE